MAIQHGLYGAGSVWRRAPGESTRSLRCMLATWRHRAASRRALRGMPEFLLADIGIDRIEAEREAAKPFWRA